MKSVKILAVLTEEAPVTGKIRRGLLLDNLDAVYPESNELINKILHGDVVGRYCAYEIKGGVLTYCEII